MDLIWVNNGLDGLTISKTTRTQIRKQVMKSAVKEKRRQQQQSMKQPEASINEDISGRGALEHRIGEDCVADSEDEQTRRPTRRFYSRRNARRGNLMPASLPATGLEVLILDYGFDLRTLTAVLCVCPTPLLWMPAVVDM